MAEDISQVSQALNNALKMFSMALSKALHKLNRALKYHKNPREYVCFTKRRGGTSKWVPLSKIGNSLI